MSTAKTPKPRPLARFHLLNDVPELARAASLALGVARHCKATSWTEFAANVDAEDEGTLLLAAGLEIDQADSMLVSKWDYVLRMLSVRPLVTVAVCPECEGWVLVAGTAPSKCRVTMRCSGKPVRAAIASKVKVDEPADV